MTDIERTRAELEEVIEALRNEFVGDSAVEQDAEEEFSISDIQDERLEAIFELAPDAYYLYDLKGRFVDGNRMAEKLTGYKREELIGKSFLSLSLLSKSDILKAAKRLIQNMRGKPTGPDVFTFIRPDNTRVDLEVRTYPVKIEGKRLVLGIARDITERKQIEEEIRTLNQTLEKKVLQATKELKAANKQLHSDIKSRLKKDKEVKEQEEHFRHIIDHANDLIYNTDKKGNITFFNPTAVKIMRRSEEELIGINYLELIRKDYKKKAEDFYGAQMKEVTPNTYFEFPAVRGDGSEIWLGQNVQPIIKNGKLKGFQAFARDVTDRKRTEIALKESERRYRAIFEDSRDVIYITGPDGYFIEINQSGLDLFGYTRDEIMKINARDIYLHPEDREDFVRELERNGYVLDYELKLKRRDGTSIDCLLSSTIRPSSDGKVLRYQGIIRDITEHKKAEEALLETERRFRELLENLKMIAVLLDLEGKIVFCNDFVSELTGHDKAELLGKNWFDIFVPEDEREMRRTEFRDNIKSGTIPIHHENVIITKENKRRNISWTNTTLKDSGGNVFGTASIGSDMTDRLKAEEQLRHAQRMEVIGKLAGGIAHDFNNALTPILALSQMHLSRLSDDDPVKKALSTINKSATRATKLTSRLMAFGRKQVLEPHVLNINTTLMSIGDLLQRSVGDDVRLKIKPGAGLWNVKADPIQMEQVLLNLAINAKDALGSSGQVTINTENYTLNRSSSKYSLDLDPGEYVLISVIDDGPGIEDEIKQYIFEPFFTTKEMGQGTGLGLSVAYGIIKQHDGEIICESQVGSGTTFKIFLPRVDKPVEEVKHEEVQEDQRGEETILLVEDDDEVREVLREILKDIGYLVIEAADGKQATKISKKFNNEIHLLLTDLILPGLNGRELSEKLAEKRSDMKVLFISGYSEDVIAKHGILDEGLSFLQKPFTAALLSKKVREVLDG